MACSRLSMRLAVASMGAQHCPEGCADGQHLEFHKSAVEHYQYVEILQGTNVIKNSFSLEGNGCSEI